MRILFVDDEKMIVETFSLMLTDLGYYVKTACGCEEALGLASREQFDIAFLDHFLGSCLGLDLMRAMAEENPDLSYVIVTANSSMDLAVESLKSGASDFISKPFRVADLIRSIEYVGKKRELKRQKRNLLENLEHVVNEKTEELKQIYTNVLSSLAQAMEKRDIGTYGHSRRVSYHARLIAAALDLPEKERADLKTAALLHDIGKIGISDFILGKQGQLNEEERQAIKNHPQKGYEILKPLKQFEPILPAILHHHEFYNGLGYPAGLAGEAIPLHARIIAVADTYDAILANRPYRSGATHESAVRELLLYSGSQFDPVIVKAFVETDAKYRHVMAAASSAKESA